MCSNTRQSQLPKRIVPEHVRGIKAGLEISHRDERHEPATEEGKRHPRVPSGSLSMRSGEQEGREAVRSPSDGATDGIREGCPEHGVERLDPEQGHGAAAHGRQIPREHVRGQAVGGGTETGGILPVEPADGARSLLHVGSVHQDDEIGREAADEARAVFWRGAALDEEKGRRVGRGADLVARALSPEKTANDLRAGGIVAAQLLADTDQGDAERPRVLGSPVSRGMQRELAQRPAGRMSPGCAQCPPRCRSAPRNPGA
jgi:hypothetical protein